MVRVALAEAACIAPTVSIARQQLFNSLYEIRSRSVQSCRKFQDGCQRWTVFSTFQETDVFGVVATFKCKFLLGQIAFLTQFEKYS